MVCSDPRGDTVPQGFGSDRVFTWFHKQMWVLNGYNSFCYQCFGMSVDVAVFSVFF